MFVNIFKSYFLSWLRNIGYSLFVIPISAWWVITQRLAKFYSHKNFFVRLNSVKSLYWFVSIWNIMSTCLFIHFSFKYARNLAYKNFISRFRNILVRTFILKNWNNNDCVNLIFNNINIIDLFYTKTKLFGEMWTAHSSLWIPFKINYTRKLLTS